MTRKKYLLIIPVIYLFFTLFLFFSDFFNIGFISDDYNNLYDAVNTSLIQKLIGNLPLTNILHLRPVYYISLQLGYHIHDLLNLNFDNFINYRIGNLILFFLFSFLCGKIIFYFTKNYYLSLLGILSVLLFPSNIHNICWTAGRVDILCGIFYLGYLLLTLSYLDKRTNFYVLGSTLSLALALLTKETAITASFVFLIFILFFKGKQFIKNNYKVIIIHFVIILFYIVYKLLIDQFHLNIAPQKSSLVFVESFVALILPIDSLSVLYQLKHNDITILIYFAIFISFSFLYFIYLFQLNFFKILFFTVLLFVISILPYAAAGYVRPQLIIIPFSLLIIFLFSTRILERSDKKINFKKSLVILFSIVLVSWGFYTMLNIRQWVFGYNNSKFVLTNLVQTNIDLNKPTFVLCNPGRLGQIFMLDEINGAYNYMKYQQPVYKDTLIDLVLTGGLDKTSSNPKLDINKINENEFDVTLKNDDSFFYIASYYIDREHHIFENDNVNIDFSLFNYINKPTNFKIKFKKNNINCYIDNDANFYKIF